MQPAPEIRLNAAEVAKLQAERIKICVDRGGVPITDMQWYRVASTGWDSVLVEIMRDCKFSERPIAR